MTDIDAAIAIINKRIKRLYSQPHTNSFYQRIADLAKEQNCTTDEVILAAITEYLYYFNH